MFKKVFALASISAVAAVFAVTGCSSSDNNDTTPADVDAGADTGAKDSGRKDSAPEDSGPESCYDESAALAIPETWTANFPGGKCTDEQLTTLIADCFEGQDTAKCTATQEAAPDCSTCVLGSNEDAIDVPAFISTSGGNGFISLYACISVAKGKPECAKPFTEYFFCTGTACGSCTPNSAEDTACSTEADQGICGQNITISDDCATMLQAVDKTDPAYTACVGTDGLSSLKLTAKQLCVTGVAAP
jgi:hypothetical protein